MTHDPAFFPHCFPKRLPVTFDRVRRQEIEGHSPDKVFLPVPENILNLGTDVREPGFLIGLPDNICCGGDQVTKSLPALA